MTPPRLTIGPSPGRRPSLRARPPGSKQPSAYERVYAVVRRIPRGRVATYGQVAALAGIPGQARLVGYALHALPDGGSVPWHRVVNAQGRTSPRSDGMLHDRLQRLILVREGIRFSPSGVLSLNLYRWSPRRAEAR